MGHCTVRPVFATSPAAATKCCRLGSEVGHVNVCVNLGLLGIVYVVPVAVDGTRWAIETDDLQGLRNPSWANADDVWG